MATYIMLASYTQQGIANIQDTTKRAEAVKAAAAKHGCTMKDTYWVLGQYDVIAVFEAPNDEAITALALGLAKAGNVKTQTLRAFTPTEMNSVLSKMV
ncbi:MAG: GYD domain-containing protein [Hyphomicrobiaceae bacterium]